MFLSFRVLARLDNSAVQCNILHNIPRLWYVHNYRSSLMLAHTWNNLSFVIITAYRDFLILMPPNIAMKIPIPTTAPNSPLPDVGIALPCNAKMIPTPATINAPPIIIRMPSNFDGSFLVIKNDVMSITAGIMPNTVPLVLTSV